MAAPAVAAMATGRENKERSPEREGATYFRENGVLGFDVLFKRKA